MPPRRRQTPPPRATEQELREAAGRAPLQGESLPPTIRNGETVTFTPAGGAVTAEWAVMPDGELRRLDGTPLPPLGEHNAEEVPAVQIGDELWGDDDELSESEPDGNAPEAGEGDPEFDREMGRAARRRRPLRRRSGGPPRTVIQETLFEAPQLRNTLQAVNLDNILPEPLAESRATDEMVESVRTLGVLQPIMVRRGRGTTRQLTIIAGRRRVDAARRAGLSTIPAVVVPFNAHVNVQAAMALTENNLRTGNPISDLRTIETMIANGGTIQTIARTLHIPTRTIERRLRLRRLIPELRAATESGEVSLNVAGQLADLLRSDQRRALAILNQRRPADGATGRNLLRRQDIIDLVGDVAAAMDIGQAEAFSARETGNGFDRIRWWREGRMGRIAVGATQFVRSMDDEMWASVNDIMQLNARRASQMPSQQEVPGTRQQVTELNAVIERQTQEIDRLREAAQQYRAGAEQSITMLLNNGTEIPEGWVSVAALLSRAQEAMPVSAEDDTDNWYNTINDLRNRAQAQAMRTNA